MNPTYKYALLNPRRGPGARENRWVFDAGPVYGVEVTVALAKRCVGNTGLQHAGADGTTAAAIEAALTCELPEPGATLATVRPRLRAFGTMAVLGMRAEGVELVGDVRDRIGEIAWAGTKWRPGLDPDAVSGRDALRVVVCDARRDVAERVAVIRTWLETGTFPGLGEAVAEVRRERAEQLVLDPEVRVFAGGRIAVIESTSPLAIVVARRHAPVVIAVNPACIQGGPEHRKVIICQTEPVHVELGAVSKELAAIEAGWGGWPRRIGSPHGKTTTIEVHRLVDVVERHRLERVRHPKTPDVTAFSRIARAPRKTDG